MIRRIYIPVFLVLLFFSNQACKKPFEHDGIKDAPSLLVVEGVINPSGITNIYLSRTLKLADKLKANPEIKAKVQIEGPANAVFPLTENTAGTYSVASLNLNPNLQYRLRIKTVSGREYLSDLLSVKNTPVIDSLNWQRTAAGVGIYSNAHDSQNNTRYYQWDYEETWEIRSIAYSEFLFKDGTMISRPMPEMELLFTCWKNERSTDILITSTDKLSADVVHRFPLTFIPDRSEKLGVKYSILVKQYAISREAYEYMGLMKRNSEQQGSIFDVQPTELRGNIKSITDPEEQVIGFIGISSVTEKRLFIQNTQVKDWNFNLGCEMIVVKNNKDSLQIFGPNRGMLATSSNLSMAGTIESYNGSTLNCLDCRTRGGNNVKPAFW